MIDEKMLRPTVQSLKDLITCGQVGEFRWAPTDLCLVDVLTKKDAKMTEDFMKIVKSGDLGAVKQKAGMASKVF